MTRTPPDPSRLEAVLGRALGDGVSVDRVTRLSGGASRETWRLDATTPGGARRALVLRREPPGGSRLPGPGVDEFRLTQLAAAAGAPVAEPLVRLEEDDDLGVGFVMALVEGETLGRKVVADDALAGARPRLARELGAALAAIHSVPVDDSGLPHARDTTPAAVVQLDQMSQLLDGFDVDRPVIEFALRRLRDDLPPERPLAVVHGDFRVGNVVVAPDGLRAVLDWELAHLGDPVEDLGWLCVRSWRFGGEGRVGGVGDAADLLESYVSAGGSDVSERELDWWEAFGNVRWAVICMVQAWTHLGGVRRSVELAAIGRRVGEVEHDLMELLA